MTITDSFKPQDFRRTRQISAAQDTQIISKSQVLFTGTTLANKAPSFQSVICRQRCSLLKQAGIDQKPWIDLLELQFGNRSALQSA